MQSGSYICGDLRIKCLFSRWQKKFSNFSLPWASSSFQRITVFFNNMLFLVVDCIWISLFELDHSCPYYDRHAAFYTFQSECKGPGRIHVNRISVIGAFIFALTCSSRPLFSLYIRLRQTQAGYMKIVQHNLQQTYRKFSAWAMHLTENSFTTREPFLNCRDASATFARQR